jgi:hypothetical protein
MNMVHCTIIYVSVCVCMHAVSSVHACCYIVLACFRKHCQNTRIRHDIQRMLLLYRSLSILLLLLRCVFNTSVLTGVVMTDSSGNISDTVYFGNKSSQGVSYGGDNRSGTI